MKKLLFLIPLFMCVSCGSNLHKGYWTEACWKDSGVCPDCLNMHEVSRDESHKKYYWDWSWHVYADDKHMHFIVYVR